MSRLLPFFSYYGGKWRAARRYQSPRFDTIIEPFAGGAGYSIRHADHNVILYDEDPILAGLWQYLIRASGAEIRALPDVIDSVDDVAGPQEARWLIGFWLNKGAAAPCKTPGAWMRGGTRASSFWGPEIKARVASQVGRIRHWRCVNASYPESPDAEATWFVDPPYSGAAGAYYRHGNGGIDYVHLAEWCRSRRGQTIVCENEGATWLPFVAHEVIKGMEGGGRSGESREVVWLSDQKTPPLHKAQALLSF